VNFSLSSRMVHQHASTTRAPLPDGPQKLLGLLQQAADTRMPGVPRRHGDARRAREAEQARDQTGMGNGSGESRTANAPRTFSSSDNDVVGKNGGVSVFQARQLSKSSGGGRRQCVDGNALSRRQVARFDSNTVAP